jgi:hypothetical protein
MTDVQTRNGAAKRAKRDRSRVADDVVSASSLASHLGMTRQAVQWLTSEAIVERRSDGLYNQAASRLRYIKHLRSSTRSARSLADSRHTEAKAEMLRIKILQQQKKLVLREDCNALLDEVVGIVLTHLSGMAARCSRDVVIRRAIDAVVHQVRTEMAQACEKLADERGEPPLDQQD